MNELKSDQVVTSLATPSVRTIDAPASATMPVPILAPPKRRGWMQRIKQYFTGADLDEVEERGGRLVPPRLPPPLPRSVKAVAIGQLVANGIMVVTSALALAAGAIAIVVLPFWQGRYGVGLSLAIMFGCAIFTLISLYPLFFARGAARLLRRDQRGIATVRKLATFATIWTGIVGLGFIIAAVGFGAFNTPNMSTSRLVFESARGLLSILTGFGFNLWSVMVMRRYRRELEEEGFPYEE